MINRVVLVGRITGEPELRRTSTGTAVVSFTLAVDNRFQRDNERSADFISCIAWNQSAEFMEKYVHKGDVLGVDGRISTRNYESNGKKVYVTEVVCESLRLLQSKNSGSRSESYEPVREEKVKESPSFDDAGFDISDEDLPF
jgi:single-strand DNA-binding protein